MPKIIKKTIFGLDISNFSIETLSLTAKGKVKHFGRITMEEGIVKDGFILDKKKLIKKIREVISEAKIKAGRVILSLPESKVFIHTFQIPKSIKEKELRNAIRSEAEKTIPLDLEKIYWDYQIIPSLLKNSQRTILFVGTLKEIVNDYVEVLDKIGLEPVAFEIESIALGRALLKDIKLKAGVMVIDIGARTTSISIFDKGKILRDSITVPAAGDQFTEAISREMKISLKKAEKLKRTHGFYERKEKGKIADILRKQLQPIIKKIERSIEYYDQEIKNILLVGGSARIPRITNYLSLNLGFKVEIGISPMAGQLGRKSVLFNTVIGLALRGLESNPEKSGINLLPEKERPKPSIVSKRTRQKKAFPYVVIGFLIIALMFLAVVIYFYILTPFSGKAPLMEKSPVEKMTPIEEETPSEPIEEKEVPPLVSEEEEEEQEVIKVVIQETETDWLNVREGPGTNYSILSKVYPGESYPLLEESEEWYKIKLVDEEGWIAIRYTATTTE